ncbi:3D domain-containing protein [Kordiimonas gwangyangensis]|nr:3D domain-containing protein [Kordiimonas gwangyangensis]
MSHLALHVPVWLSATYPDPTSREAEPLPLERLMVAQDTGGAIRGEIRGDVFWGFGAEAEEIAGRMANKGRYWLLLPTPLAAKLLESQNGG